MKDTIKYLFIVIAVLTASTSCYSGDIPLPDGWRIPNAIETKEEWRSKDSNRYILVKADFNGDGVVDQARLLIRVRDSALGLFAFLSQKGDSYKAYLLDEIKDTVYIKVMGINIALPGRYTTACGKGAYECVDDPPEIQLENAAIDYFKFDSANMYIYWDKAAQNFKRVGIND